MIKSGVRNQVSAVHITISERVVFTFPFASRMLMRIPDIDETIAFRQKNIKLTVAGSHLLCQPGKYAIRYGAITINPTSKGKMPVDTKKRDFSIAFLTTPKSP